HMALDEVLTYEVGAGKRPPTLRIWEWSSNAVILGRFQSVRNEVDPVGATKHDISVMRRITGGGAMFVEPENTITYSIYAPDTLVKGMSFIDSYEFMDDWVLEGLRSLGVAAEYIPINDISSVAGKIGGAAQTRRGGAVLHHVTMAYDMNPAKMLEVLRIGREKLSDKGSVSANKRVAPLRQQTQLPREVVIDRLVATFKQRYGLTDGPVTADELARAEALAEEKFMSDEWRYLLP
ncbi:MAG TPA: biotin/lipoate A/B protein ligase family protein, partial [Trueperaceae bacterium]|nr:biotin/lipoate A/B protein ligase family protein [Trueperaceae bacterium]